MSTNVGNPNYAPTYHKMNLEEYKKMSFVPTKANLEKRRLEQEQAASQDQQSGNQTTRSVAHDMTDRHADIRKSKDLGSPLSITSTSTSEKRYDPQREPRRLSGGFNSPTSEEINSIKKTEKSVGGFRHSIRKLTRKSSPPTVA